MPFSRCLCSSGRSAQLHVSVTLSNGAVQENVEEYLKDKDSVEEGKLAHTTLLSNLLKQELRKIQNQFERYKMLELHLARRKFASQLIFTEQHFAFILTHS